MESVHRDEHGEAVEAFDEPFGEGGLAGAGGSGDTEQTAASRRREAAGEAGEFGELLRVHARHCVIHPCLAPSSVIRITSCPMPHIALVTLVVDDYDRAIAFYTDALGFELVEDSDRGNGTRWVVVRPRGAGDTASLLLARAGDEAQRASIGAQTGGRVGFFLHTDDFARDHARMLAAGVRFVEQPRHEPYGSVAVFEDLYGNRWDLLQPA